MSGLIVSVEVMREDVCLRSLRILTIGEFLGYIECNLKIHVL